MSTSASSDAVRAAFDAQRQTRAEVEVELPALIESVFGPDARVRLTNEQKRPPYWFDTRVVAHVDSAWHTAGALIEAARQLGALGVRAELAKLQESAAPGGSETKYRIVVELFALRAPEPQPAPSASVGDAAASGPPTFASCPECHTEHRVFASPKPYPGAEREWDEVLCLACGRHPFSIAYYTDYRVERDG